MTRGKFGRMLLIMNSTSVVLSRADFLKTVMFSLYKQREWALVKFLLRKIWNSRFLSFL